SPTCMQSWHYKESCGIHNFLTFVQGRWPPPRITANAHDRAIQSVADEDGQHLHEQRALSPPTIAGHVDEARRFLQWLPRRELSVSLAELTIRDVDRFIKARAAE